MRTSLPPIRVYICVWIVIGLPITIEVCAVCGIGRNRVRRQESSRYRIIVALLHVAQAGIGINHMTGEARALFPEMRVSIQSVGFV